MRQYVDLVNHIKHNSCIKENRTGIDTLADFGYHYTVDTGCAFPILTTKKISWKNIVIENLWFLGKSRSSEFLHKHGVKFWDPWMDSEGNLPEAYGEYWRNYPLDTSIVNYPYPFDQFKHIIETLNKDPNNRRLVLTNWYPPVAWQVKLPPCHLMAIFNVICGELNLHLTQRSCDVALGVPYNLSGYAFLLHLIAQ